MSEEPPDLQENQESPSQEPPSVETDRGDEKASVETLRDVLTPELDEATVDAGSSRSVAARYIDDRSYRTGIRQVMGPVHSGGGNIYYYAQPSLREVDFAFGQVVTTTLHKVRSVYVPPSGYANALSRLREHRVLILRGQKGMGKWTSALNLGISLCDNHVVEITPNVRLSRLSDNLLSQDSVCYVVDSLHSSGADDLTRATLTSLSNRLSAPEVDSYLIVCIDIENPVPGDQVHSYLLDWSIPSAVQTLLRNHLEYYLGEERIVERALSLTTQEPLVGFLEGQLNPREIDSFCRAIADWMNAGEKSAVDTVLEQLEAHAYRSVGQWFESKNDDLYLVSLMIAAAVFQGATYETIAEAGERLQRRLADLTGQSDAGMGQLRTRQYFLDQLHAHPEQTVLSSSVGPVTAEVIYFDNPAFQPLVLRYAWRELGIGREIVEWLSGYAGATDRQARSVAAITLGELAKYDFAFVFERSIRRLANSDNSRERDSAALALGVPVWSPDLAPLVLDQLHHWATLDNNSRLQWTAAVAFGDLAGMRFPDLALKNLKRIVQSEKIGAIRAAARSIISLFRAGAIVPDYYTKVLRALLTWTESSEEVVAVTAMLVFLDLAKSLWFMPEGSDDSWPIILWLVSSDEQLDEPVCELFRAVLNRQDARSDGLDAVKLWLSRTDGMPGYREAIEHFIVSLAQRGTEHERQRLKAYLERWHRHPTDPLEAAGALVQRL